MAVPNNIIMKRRNFIVTGTIAALATGTITTALAAGGEVLQPKRTFYNHSLLFWLKKELTEKEVEAFTGFFTTLSRLPYVKALYYGKPANSTPRKVVDNSFTYNLVMEFDSLEDLEAYGKLPDHLDAIKKYSPYWERMIVHDAVLQQVR